MATAMAVTRPETPDGLRLIKNRGTANAPVRGSPQNALFRVAETRLLTSKEWVNTGDNAAGTQTIFARLPEISPPTSGCLSPLGLVPGFVASDGMRFCRKLNVKSTEPRKGRIPGNSEVSS